MSLPPLAAGRRRFLEGLGALGALPWLAGLGAAGAARATSATGYRALVCLFQFGGNDAYNTVLATDAASWSAYAAARGAGTDPIALPPAGTPPQPGSPSVNLRLGGVLPIQPANAQARSFALHPGLGSLAGLFAQKRLAVVANVGPLVQPTTKAAYLANAATLPPRLYSHNDQQSVWQSMGPEGTPTGWGGGLADLLQSANLEPMFTSVSVHGAAVWPCGRSVRPYGLAPAGPVLVGNPTGVLFGSSVVQQQLRALMRTPRTRRVIEAEHAAVAGRSIDAQALLASALPAAAVAPWGTPGLAAGQLDPLLLFTAPSTGLRLANPVAQQLQAVARMVAARAALGSGRQIFFVGIDGHDTHDAQNGRHADLMAQLAQALGYWDTVTRAMGVDAMVTLFTASDFGRAFASNGSGSDHGWGGHHFVMGGAVKGGDIYGRFPVLGPSDGAGGFASNDQVDAGALLPALSVDQYAATLGAWLGVSAADLTTVLPDLANFPATQRDLGFMSA